MPRKPATKASVLQMPTRSNGTDPQPPANSAHSISNRRITSLLPITREKIGFAFLRGTTLRTLRVSYALPIGAVEEVVREQMRERLNRRAA